MSGPTQNGWNSYLNGKSSSYNFSYGGEATHPEPIMPPAPVAPAPVAPTPRPQTPQLPAPMPSFNIVNKNKKDMKNNMTGGKRKSRRRSKRHSRRR
jgi:hypothetical protein